MPSWPAHRGTWQRAIGVAVALALFGGYRDDHPESVLGLHVMYTARVLAHLVGTGELAGYAADVRSRVR